MRVFFQEQQVKQKMGVKKGEEKSVTQNGAGCGDSNKEKKVD